MLWKNPLELLTTLLLGLILAANVSAAPKLNGLSMHQELGNEQFIGALYSEALSNDPDSLINASLPARMELKVVAPGGLTTRRFSRMWIEGMAINNNNDLLTAQADNMVKFDGLFKGTLAQNDHVVFSLTPGSGVDISVNKVLLGNIPDDRFFGMLLRTWIGRVPLSSGYRADLLKMGDVPGALLSRYESISFDPARVAVISAWNKPKPAETEVAAAPRSEPARTRPEPAQPAARPTVEAPAVAVPRVELPPLQTETTTAAAPAAAEPVASTPASSQPAAEPAPAAREVAVVQPAAAVEEEDDAPVLTAQSLLARQFYVSDVLRKIRSKVTYPRISQERGQEGSMRIAVTLDRNGNILEMAWLEESRHDRLNKEAWEAVRRAAPFPPMPDSLPGHSFELTAPISFEMQK